MPTKHKESFLKREVYTVVSLPVIILTLVITKCSTKKNLHRQVLLIHISEFIFIV